MPSAAALNAFTVCYNNKKVDQYWRRNKNIHDYVIRMSQAVGGGSFLTNYGLYLESEKLLPGKRCLSREYRNERKRRESL